jgi:hypothetical protein
MHGGQSTHLRYTLGMVVDRLQQMGRPSITMPSTDGAPIHVRRAGVEIPHARPAGTRLSSGDSCVSL